MWDQILFGWLSFDKNLINLIFEQKDEKVSD